QFPDSVKEKIEQILPGGTVDFIDHWGPFRYTVTKVYEEGHSHKIFIYLNSHVQKVDYMQGEYKERPGVFFVTGTGKELELNAVPQMVLDNIKKHSGSENVVGAWVAESDIGPTYVMEIQGFQDDGVYAFAYRPDGILKTLSEANIMRMGVSRKWTKEEIIDLLGKYRKKYGVENVIKRIQSVPFDPDKGFRFVVFGDNRINRPVWETICRSMSNKHPLFVINTGDMVREGEPEQFDEYLFAVLEKYGKFNFLPTVGNHDIGFDGLAVSYLTAFSARALTYYFDYGNARFVMLDNVSRATSLKEELNRVEQWLANTPEGFHKFVFMHYPPEKIRKWAYHGRGRAEMQRFTEMMTEYEVDHVFAGHIHAYSTATWLGVDYTVTGGGGAELHKQYGPKGSVYHYVIVDVRSNEIQQQVVRLYKD
ncbi:MAG: metallophosphoesterase family protein, partial [bacterium]